MADNLTRDTGGPDGADAAGAIQLAQAAAPGAAAAGRTLVAVDAPPQGTSEMAIEVAAGEDFLVEFDPAAAEVTLEDANLVFTFADGARTVLVGFADIEPPPSLILPDGTVVAGGIIVAQVGGATEVLSLEAAAGPGSLLGGGNNVYSDDMGDVIGMLGPQGTIPLTAFSFGLEAPEEPIDEVLAAGLAPPEDFDIRVQAQFVEKLPFELGGLLFFSQDSNSNGLYVIDITTGHATLVGDGITSVTSGNVGLSPAALGSTLLFGTSSGSVRANLIEIDQDGTGVDVVATETAAEGLAYDRDNDILYGTKDNRFYSIDPSTGAKIADLENRRGSRRPCLCRQRGDLRSGRRRRAAPVRHCDRYLEPGGRYGP